MNPKPRVRYNQRTGQCSATTQSTISPVVFGQALRYAEQYNERGYRKALSPITRGMRVADELDWLVLSFMDTGHKDRCATIHSGKSPTQEHHDS